MGRDCSVSRLGLRQRDLALSEVTLKTILTKCEFYKTEVELNLHI